jgi:hypothetical protein
MQPNGQLQTYLPYDVTSSPIAEGLIVYVFYHPNRVVRSHVEADSLEKQTQTNS